MDLHVNLQSRRDLAGQIYRELRTAILDGRLRRGERVPPTRELARRLKVSRNTVSVAYEWLTAEGLLAGRPRAGSFVQGEAPARGGRPRASSGVHLRARAFWSEQPAPGAPEAPSAYDFRVGIPDAQLFPFEAWRRLMTRQLRAAAMPAGYGEAAGHPGLREAVARHVGVARGVRADAGGRHRHERRAAGARPHRAGAHRAGGLRRRGGAGLSACPAAVPVPGGARRPAFPSTPRASRCVRCRTGRALVYVTPSHQFPLGMPMSPARRSALLDWAEQRDAVVIEDDYDSEFRFGGRPLETLHGLDRCGRVIYVGSFSKVMLPALRLGFLIAPALLQRELRRPGA